MFETLQLILWLWKMVLHVFYVNDWLPTLVWGGGLPTLNTYQSWARCWLWTGIPQTTYVSSWPLILSGCCRAGFFLNGLNFTLPTVLYLCDRMNSKAATSLRWKIWENSRDNKHNIDYCVFELPSFFKTGENRKGLQTLIPDQLFSLLL